MPALPAGLSSMPSDRAAATTSGVFQRAIGSTSGKKLHAITTVSRPVGIRSMSHGATIAPAMPASPAAVSTRPI